MLLKLSWQELNHCMFCRYKSRKFAFEKNEHKSPLGLVYFEKDARANAV